MYLVIPFKCLARVRQVGVRGFFREALLPCGNCKPQNLRTFLDPRLIVDDVFAARRMNPVTTGAYDLGTRVKAKIDGHAHLIAGVGKRAV